MSSRAEGSKKEAHKKTEKIGYDPVGLRKCMERELDPRRYEHTLGVAYTAGGARHALWCGYEKSTDCRASSRLCEKLKQ